MLDTDRGEFTRDGFLILRELVPRERLSSLRASYDVLTERQKQALCSKSDSGPKSQWETNAQPRIVSTETLVDHETSNAVEVWVSDPVLAVAQALLASPNVGVSAMQVLCNPSFEAGPAKWHRDIHPIDMGPMQLQQEAVIENGPTYIQFNIPLYDDEVLWVVPGSHARLNTTSENERLNGNARIPLPGGVPVKLRAGDGVVYNNHLLHWGSNYTAETKRRTLHGGYTIFPSWEDIGFSNVLSAKSCGLFESWRDRTRQLKDATESCLRAVHQDDQSAYRSGLEFLQPRIGPAGVLQLTIWLCKAAMHVYLLKSARVEDVSNEIFQKATVSHPISLNWGPGFAERFSVVESDAIWQKFRKLDQLLRTANGTDYVPGYQSGPIPYFIESIDDRFCFSELFST